MQLKFTQTDGFVYDLLHFLWLKDPMTRTAPLINIPYTVQIVTGQAKFWYFSKDGKILRKSKEKLDPDYLEKVFASESIDKIEAAWIYFENEKLKFNYMNSFEVSNFIGRLDYKANGVLQAFIYPKGENNSTIKCIWQESSCIFEYIYNINKMKKTQLSINQRITTFETDGGPTLSVTYIILIFRLNSNTLARTLNELCKEIKQHILNVTFEQIKITLMELYFRTGSDGKIYLLFCSKIRTTKQRSLSENKLNQLILKVPLAKGPNRVEIINQRCIGCKIIQNQNLFEEISIKEIIESWDKNHQITYKQDPPIIEMDKNCLIPKILRFIYPNLEFDKYQSLKYNVGFTTQRVKICTKCYRDIQNNKAQFSIANFSIKKRLLLRQKSSQSTFYYDTQSIKKTVHSQDSFNCNTQSQTKNSSSHKRSISTVSMVYKQKCYTHNNFTQSISQIFRNEQDYNSTDKKTVDQIQIIQ